ncbi:MAG: cytochrome c-type biogenesis protein CcmH [Actinomycetota bacterium]|nr:cytochrome c-type biogenesis protein CcmH [Actinomycetota bacterium]
MSETDSGAVAEVILPSAPGAPNDVSPTRRPPRQVPWARRLPWWTLLAVVLAAALVVGSGVLSSAPPTPAQRAFAIESSLRCPSCEDLSVADSSAPTAVTVRATVRQLVAEGRTSAQIESYLASRYGSSIVLVPPASGWSLLVWVLPTAGGALALAALAIVLVRRRRTSEHRPGPEEARRWAETVARTGGRAALEEQRVFLARSLADAEAEHRAGDLSDTDHSLLVERDTARLDAVGACLDALASGGPAGNALLVGVEVADAGSDGLGSGSSGTDGEGTSRSAVASPLPAGRRRGARRRSWRQRVLLGGAVTAFAAAAAVGVSIVATRRLPGQTVSGSISLSRRQKVVEQLDQAATEENSGHDTLAIRLYQDVLAADPGNEVALAQLGWLEYETGVAGGDPSLAASGTAKLERAVSLAPSDYAAHLYLGTVLASRQGGATAAVAQFDDFLADHPPTSLVAQAAPVLRRAYAAAGVPLPPLPTGG